ncbi:MAG: competence/damage-inducible protein A [Aerococcus sp.]|nr:competence/damage-inducible protein A [Aerococcus sp.]
MKAETIAVGTEMLMGQIVNTNAPYIAHYLNQLGIEHYWETVVGDNPTRLVEATQLAEQRSDIIIYTGGIGPTRDDLTKQTVSEYLHEPLIHDEATLISIKNWLKKRELAVTENNLEQALTFEHGTPLPNPVGMAVGTALTKQGVTYIFLPGFPGEMRAMFETAVDPYLRQLIGDQSIITSRYLNYFGIGEAQLASDIDDLIESQTNPTLAIYASGRTVTVRTTARSQSEETNNQALSAMANQINQRLGAYYYGEGLNVYPSEALVNRLKQLEQTVTVCESLTGGLASHEIVSVAGASNVFHGGLVTYDAPAKIKLAHVDQQTITKHGMVSVECAREMALGAKEQLQTNYAISFTGVAGPDQMEEQPVGSVYIGIAGVKEEPIVKHFQWNGSRTFIRQRAVDQGFILLLEQLKQQ